MTTEILKKDITTTLRVSAHTDSSLNNFFISHIPILTQPALDKTDFMVEATLSEKHISTITVTDNPIETGALISDNAIIEPQQLDLVLGFSNTPNLGFVGNLTGLGDAGRINAVYEAFRDLQISLLPLNIQTGLLLYENMLITSLSTTRTTDNNNIIIINLSLREVILVEISETKIPASNFKKGVVRDKSSSNVDRGEIDAPENTNDNQTSWLKDLKGLLF